MVLIGVFYVGPEGGLAQSPSPLIQVISLSGTQPQP